VYDEKTKPKLAGGTIYQGAKKANPRKRKWKQKLRITEGDSYVTSDLNCRKRRQKNVSHGVGRLHGREREGIGRPKEYN